MARVVLGPMISDARGKQGGLVFSRNASGHYTRAKVSPTQPFTANRYAIKRAMTIAAQYWRDTLTAALRAAWEKYAQATPITDRFGAKATLSGINMFLRFNVWWYSDGGAILTAAPAIPGEGPMFSCALAATSANGLVFSTPDPIIGTGDRVVVQLCLAPTSNARTSYSGPWTQVTAFGSATAFPFTCTTTPTVAIGQQWWVRMRYFDALGKVGPPWMGSAKCTA